MILAAYSPRLRVQRSIENSTVLPSSYSATNATRLLVIGSRGLACVDERARHFLLDPLHRASADTKLGGNLENAFALAQMSLDSFLYGWTYPRPS
jgi:hypothetical protein